VKHLLALALMLFIATSTFVVPRCIGQTKNPQHKQVAAAPKAMSPQEVFRLTSPSVVVVNVLDLNDKVVARGSGVVVAAERVVTNRHVIEDGGILKISQGDKTWRAYILWVDPDHDLGVLKVRDFRGVPISVRTSHDLSVGERVYAIGSPRGLELTLSEGLVSGLREYEDGRIIQTSAPISPGSSGGGLFDEQGRLVGITSFGLTESENLNFALPAEWIQALPTFLTTPTKSKEPSKQDVAEAKAALLFASTAASNVQTFVDQRRILHSDSGIPKGTSGVLDAIASGVTACLIDEAGSECSDSWPIWQQALPYMLELRTQIIGSGRGKDDLEIATLNTAREAWAKVRDVYCKDRPRGNYTDLEGEIRTCPGSQ